MFKRIFLLAACLSVSFFAGCATVPMASIEQDSTLKAFSQPSEDKAGIYIFRTGSAFGGALIKNIYVDEVLIGATAPKTYFYREITTGQHQISTQSEFGLNSVSFQAEGGKNYYCQQYIKMGVFIGGANVKMVSEEEGIKQVRKCGLAK